VAILTWVREVGGRTLPEYQFWREGNSEKEEPAWSVGGGGKIFDRLKPSDEAQFSDPVQRRRSR
jgi:hypothetical protein